jgi:hypothetical protein
VLEKRVRDAVADSLTAARYDSDFTREVGDVAVEGEVVRGDLVGRMAKVLGNSVLVVSVSIQDHFDGVGRVNVCLYVLTLALSRREDMVVEILGMLVVN